MEHPTIPIKTAARSHRTKWGGQRHDARPVVSKKIKNEKKIKIKIMHYDNNNSNVIIPERRSPSPGPPNFLWNSQATRTKVVKQ